MSSILVKEIDPVATMERAEIIFYPIQEALPLCVSQKLFLHARTWAACSGPNLEEGIVGFGPTPEAALPPSTSATLARFGRKTKLVRSRRAV